MSFRRRGACARCRKLRDLVDSISVPASGETDRNGRDRTFMGRKLVRVCAGCFEKAAPEERDTRVLKRLYHGEEVMEHA